MRRLRLWHLMIALAVLGVTMALVRLDPSCTPMIPILAGTYICGYLGLVSASRYLWASCSSFLLGVDLLSFVWFKV